jgi:quercetin dioxygenase-like cupin family protein
MEETPLDVLERLTPTLSDINTELGIGGQYEQLRSCDLIGETLEQVVENGTSLLWAIHNNREIAIAKGFMSAGTIFPEHIHKDIHEWGFILEGAVIVKVDDEEIKLGRGGNIHLMPDQIHTITAELDTWYIVITIPADKGMPDVRKS